MYVVEKVTKFKVIYKLLTVTKYINGNHKKCLEK